MMRPVIILLAIILVAITSCRELYDPKIDTVGAPLVVDGLITDEAKSYSVKLSNPLPFENNSDNNVDTKEYTGVSGAQVTVSDDCGNSYNFIEINGDGVYKSDPSKFVGVPGRSYTLVIKTTDNKEYRSAPQLLLPNDFNSKVEADFGSQDQLVDDGTGTLHKTIVGGTSILYTIENNEDTTIKFRFSHKTYKQYTESGLITNRCWGLSPDNDLVNIIDSYSSSTNNIVKHNVCFIPNAKDGSIIIAGADYVIITNKFITKVIQYRLNDEAYQFYKDVNTLLASTNKIFDPVTLKVKGNMKCISGNSEVLGFFEASSARVNYYALTPGSKELQFVKSYEPPFDYGCPESPPDFWVY